MGVQPVAWGTGEAEVLDFKDWKRLNARASGKLAGAALGQNVNAAGAVYRAHELRCRERDGIPLARESLFVAPDRGQGLILSAFSKRAGAYRAFIVDTGAARNVIGRKHLTPQERARIYKVDPIQFGTANGVITVDEATVCRVPNLGKRRFTSQTNAHP